LVGHLPSPQSTKLRAQLGQLGGRVCQFLFLRGVLCF
jgi:hypothetical protein